MEIDRGNIQIWALEKVKCHAFVFAHSPNTKLSPVLKVSFIDIYNKYFDKRFGAGKDEVFR